MPNNEPYRVTHYEYDELPKAYIDKYRKLFLLLPFLHWTDEWMTLEVCKNFFRTLCHKAIPRLPRSFQSSFLVALFQSNLDRRKANDIPGNAIVWSLVDQFGVEFVFSAFLFLIAILLQLSMGYLQALLLDWMGKPESPLWHGYLFVGIVIVSQLCIAWLLKIHVGINLKLGLKIRSVLMATIYKKLLVLSPRSRAVVSTGKLISLYSVDVERFAWFFEEVHYIWAAPILITGALAMICLFTGYYGLLMLVAIVLSIPLQVFFMVFFISGYKKNLIAKDQRTKTTNEVLQGIEVIKFFNWEVPMLRKILRFRSKEIKSMYSIIFGWVSITAIANALPGLMGASIFLVLQISNPLEAKVILPTLSYIGTFSAPLTFLPMTFGFAVQARVSLRRIEEFLNMEESENEALGNDAEYPIKVKNGLFKWEESFTEVQKKNSKLKKGTMEKIGTKEEQFQKYLESTTRNNIVSATADDLLSNLNLKIPKNSLSVLVGKLGSGKSSIISALVQDMKKLEGTVLEISGTVAYVPQEPWIQNVTLEENITFGLPFDQSKFDEVVRVCSLETDLASFPYGAKTILGEGGVVLSGGQKARVSLARAVYRNASIYLLDDPLSSLDNKVAKEIWENCICGYLKNKTRLLTTHQLHFISNCHCVFVINNMKIIEQGTFSELSQRSDSHLSLLLKGYSMNAKSVDDLSAIPRQKKDYSKSLATSDKLIDDEELNSGSISLSVILSYFFAIKGPLVLVPLLFLFIFSELIQVSSMWWLCMWIDQTWDISTQTYIIVYLSLLFASPFVFWLKDFIYSHAGTHGATNLHHSAINRVIKAPMSFFHTTPIGRILNRFNDDQFVMDFLFIANFQMGLSTFIKIVIGFGFAIYGNAWFSIPLLVMSIFYLFIWSVYRKTSREIRRLDSTEKSPLCARFSETISGIATIRSYHEEERFQKTNEKIQDVYLRIEYYRVVLKQWIALRLNLISGFIVILGFLLAVIFKDSEISQTTAIVGLGITQLLVTPYLSQHLINVSTNAEMQFSGAERLIYYGKHVPQEDFVKNSKPLQKWPSKGEIRFHNYCLRYRANTPLVLKNISFKINGGEKIGIVGRSGSGKSSIIQGLFRLVEPFSGSIFIDDVDITSIDVYQARLGLSIIPQDPLLFEGTIRSNIDPFFMKSDEELHVCLKRAKIWGKVSSMKGNLYARVEDRGSNFSQGEKQLLCLARALVKTNSILCLDECTASCDWKSAKKIQETIREEFSHCTVLTIAHRIETIIDYDRIMLIEDGELQEFDSPKNLLSKESKFSSMVNELGPDVSRKIFQMLQN